MSTQTPKVVVYTAISGHYDCLKEPHYIDDGIDYICFTDDEELESETWMMAPFPEAFQDSTLQTRYVKILAHRFLSDYDISIWIDANIVIQDDIKALIQNCLGSNDIAMFEHPQHHETIAKEVEVCISLAKEQPDKLLAQQELYYSLGFTDSDHPIPASYVIFRRHNHQYLALAMEDWWLNVLTYSKRDQVSFPFITWKYNLQVHYLSHQQFLHYFAQYPHDGDERDRILHLLAHGGLFRVSNVNGTLRIQQQGCSDQRALQITTSILSTLQYESMWKVIHGPFRDLVYPQLTATGSALLPKLLGTYESELHPIIDEVLTCHYDLIVNIGAGEGYYAVGLLLKSQSSRLIAFEINPKGQDACRLMAQFNKVEERITIMGQCDHYILNDLTQQYKTGLILCDCEGAEIDLLDPDQVYNLRKFDILVELHELQSQGPTISELFQSRFYHTHNIKFINIRQHRDLSHLSFEGVSRPELQFLVSEGRQYSIGWLFLKAKEN